MPYTKEETNYIYEIKFPSGMSYIGRTTNLRARMKQHQYNPIDEVKSHMEENNYTFDDAEYNVLRVCLYKGSALRIEKGIIRRYHKKGKALNNHIPKKKKKFKINMPNGRTRFV